MEGFRFVHGILIFVARQLDLKLGHTNGKEACTALLLDRDGRVAEYKDHVCKGMSTANLIVRLPYRIIGNVYILPRHAFCEIILTLVRTVSDLRRNYVHNKNKYIWKNS